MKRNKGSLGGLGRGGDFLKGGGEEGGFIREEKRVSEDGFFKRRLFQGVGGSFFDWEGGGSFLMGRGLVLVCYPPPKSNFTW